MSEVRGGVIRIGDAGVFRLVALVASRVGKQIAIVRMAIRARRGDVLSGQRESCHVVVEHRGAPGNRGMAYQAIVTVSACGVVRRDGRVEIIVVAAETVRRELAEPFVGVTFRANKRPVGPGEWKGREDRKSVV